MDTKLATSQIRLREWAALIQDCKSSGLKVNEYCRQHSISRDSYYFWLRKVRTAALEQIGFVELPVPEGQTDITAELPVPSFTTQMIIQVGNLELDINENTPSELLSRVLKVIQNAE